MQKMVVEDGRVFRIKPFDKRLKYFLEICHATLVVIPQGSFCAVTVVP